MTTDYISSSKIIPCQPLVQRCVENSVENMHTDVRVLALVIWGRYSRYKIFLFK